MNAAVYFITELLIAVMVVYNKEPDWNGKFYLTYTTQYCMHFLNFKLIKIHMK